MMESQIIKENVILQPFPSVLPRLAGNSFVMMILNLNRLLGPAWACIQGIC
jgi:hypothetical protein